MRANSPGDVTLAKSKWPKVLSPLTESQQQINDDFVKVWDEELPRYQSIERFSAFAGPACHHPRDASSVRQATLRFRW
jgi:hypothetical protein